MTQASPFQGWPVLVVLGTGSRARLVSLGKGKTTSLHPMINSFSQYSRRSSNPWSHRRFLDAPLSVAVNPPHQPLATRLAVVLGAARRGQPSTERTAR